MNLRKLAKGQACYLRLTGCPNDTSTTVLAHIRRGGIGGTGIKPCDFAAMPMDFYCHQRYDGQVKCESSRTEMDADALRGLVQWLTKLEREGMIGEKK